MNTGTLNKINLEKSLKLKNNPFLQVANIELNKAINKKQKKKKFKICINDLQKRLIKRKEKEKYESRILFGLFFSVVAVLFFVAT
tara:strand:+ start:226 stop:480 length:255 start_codon:yes stop_codon:yes gene_type:complete